MPWAAGCWALRSSLLPFGWWRSGVSTRAVGLPVERGPGARAHWCPLGSGGGVCSRRGLGMARWRSAAAGSPGPAPGSCLRAPSRSGRSGGTVRPARMAGAVSPDAAVARLCGCRVGPSWLVSFFAGFGLGVIGILHACLASGAAWAGEVAGAEVGVAGGFLFLVARRVSSLTTGTPLSAPLMRRPVFCLAGSVRTVAVVGLGEFHGAGALSAVRSPNRRTEPGRLPHPPHPPHLSLGVGHAIRCWVWVFG